MMGAYGIAKSKADTEFTTATKSLDWESLEAAQMVALMHHCWGLMDRIGTWDWRQEIIEELTIP
jgi:hypothetical protein